MCLRPCESSISLSAFARVALGIGASRSARSGNGGRSAGRRHRRRRSLLGCRDDARGLGTRPGEGRGHSLAAERGTQGPRGDQGRARPATGGRRRRYRRFQGGLLHHEAGRGPPRRSQPYRRRGRLRPIPWHPGRDDRRHGRGGAGDRSGCRAGRDDGWGRRQHRDGDDDLWPAYQPPRVSRAPDRRETRWRGGAIARRRLGGRGPEAGATEDHSSAPSLLVCRQAAAPPRPPRHGRACSRPGHAGGVD